MSITTQVAAVETVGISPKAKLAAALTATLGSLVSIAAAYAVTTELDKSALVGVISGFLLAAIAYLGAYIGDPGTVVVEGSGSAVVSKDAPHA